MKYHKGLTSGHWNKYNIFEQMANIGSEVFRAISWKTRDKKLSLSAFYRALELFDLTINDRKNKKYLKEICRAREVLVDYFVGDNEYNSTDEQWQKYFYSFNWAARINR